MYILLVLFAFWALLFGKISLTPTWTFSGLPARFFGGTLLVLLSIVMALGLVSDPSWNVHIAAITLIVALSTVSAILAKKLWPAEAQQTNPPRSDEAPKKGFPWLPFILFLFSFSFVALTSYLQHTVLSPAEGLWTVVAPVVFITMGLSVIALFFTSYFFSRSVVTRLWKPASTFGVMLGSLSLMGAVLVGCLFLLTAMRTDSLPSEKTGISPQGTSSVAVKQLREVAGYYNQEVQVQGEVPCSSHKTPSGISFPKGLLYIGPMIRSGMALDFCPDCFCSKKEFKIVAVEEAEKAGHLVITTMNQAYETEQRTMVAPTRKSK